MLNNLCFVIGKFTSVGVGMIWHQTVSNRTQFDTSGAFRLIFKYHNTRIAVATLKTLWVSLFNVVKQLAVWNQHIHKF